MLVQRRSLTLVVFLCATTLHVTSAPPTDLPALTYEKPASVEQGVYDRLRVVHSTKLPTFDNISTAPVAQQKERLSNGFICGAFGDALGNIDEFNVIDRSSAMKKVHSLAGLIKHKKSILKYKDNFLTPNNKVVVTDDTVMTGIILQLAPALKDKSAFELLTLLGQAYEEDAKTGKYGGWNLGHRAPGNRCIDAAKKMMSISSKQRKNPLWVYAGAQNKASGGGCGTIMRSASYGWVFHDDIAKAAQTAALDMITHGADSSIIASACFAAANAGALQGKNIDQIIDIVEQVAKTYDAAIAARRNDSTSVVKKLQELKALSNNQLATSSFYEKYQGWGAADFLIATLGTVKKYQHKTVQDGILAVVHSESKQAIDRDSVASGVGQLMGSMGIPVGFDLEMDGNHIELHAHRLTVATQAADRLF